MPLRGQSDWRTVGSAGRVGAVNAQWMGRISRLKSFWFAKATVQIDTISDTARPRDRVGQCAGPRALFRGLTDVRFMESRCGQRPEIKDRTAPRPMKIMQWEKVRSMPLITPWDKAMAGDTRVAEDYWRNRPPG